MYSRASIVSHNHSVFCMAFVFRAAALAQQTIPYKPNCG